MKKKNFLRKIIFLFIPILLIGCVAKKEEKKVQEVVMWLVGSESQAKTIDALGKAFFKDKGLRFRCEAISWGEAHSKYLTSIAGGVVPDIATMGLTWGTEFGSLGVMVDLAATYPQDLEKIKKETFPGIWEACQYKDRVYGIPLDLTEHIMYYRTDIIESAPRTWQDLTDLLLKLKSQNKGMIFDWGSLEWIGFSLYLWQAGGDYYNKEGAASTLASDAAATALKFFTELYTKYSVPKTSIPVEQGMRTGDFPLAISGNWKMDGLTLAAPEIKSKWSICLLPSGPTGRRTTFMGGRIIGILSQSKYKKEAWEFIKFLFSPDIQVEIYKAAVASQDTYLPPNVDTWDKLPMEANFKRILKSQALDAKGPPSVLGWDQSTRFIDEAIQRVVLQGASPEEELKKAEKELTRNIKIR
jgi:ABC-type glycerol-3-phosphate transport system substrate-binding protein